MTVVGIDVGGRKKGFHVVALCSGSYQGHYSSRDAVEIFDWCQSLKACAVGVDAPCRWSSAGRSRFVERELLGRGIGCFSTPTKARALEHGGNYFGWIFCGMEIYRAFARCYKLFSGAEGPRVGKIIFETFPHAISCALAGEIVSAKKKRAVRRSLLAKCRIDTGKLANTDYVDAALCAVTAVSLLRRDVETLGDIREGLIVIPKRPIV